MNDPDDRVQMNVRVPRHLRDTIDTRRAPLHLSRDAWVSRALTWALQRTQTTSTQTAPGKRTIRPARGRPFTNRVDYHEEPDGWHWTFTAVETATPLGTSPGGYDNLTDCRQAIHRILLANESAPVEFKTLNGTHP